MVDAERRLVAVMAGEATSGTFATEGVLRRDGTGVSSGATVEGAAVEGAATDGGSSYWAAVYAGVTGAWVGVRGGGGGKRV
jgi:hypothetical protein